MEQMRYALADQVFVCLNGDHVVMLDLRADRYWTVEAARTAGLAAIVPGWPEAVSVDGPQTRQQLSEIIAVLCGRGVLTGDIAHGKAASPVVAQPARAQLSQGALSAGGLWAPFAKSALFAKFAMRLCSLEGIIRRVQRRKPAMRRAGFDLDQAGSLVEAFIRHRIFLFSFANECLFDSLALLEFLARHDIYPDWVFGVQTRPFAAHCWVQHEGVVFNDTVEHVSSFTPIMIV
jgi:Transglutaminase-like superfamily